MDDNDSILQAKTPLGIILELIYWYFALAFIISLPVTILAYFELSIYFDAKDMDFETGLFWVWWDVFKQSLTWLPDTLKWVWDILF